MFFITLLKEFEKTIYIPHYDISVICVIELYYHFQSYEEPGADLSSESESGETDRVDVEGDDDTLSLPYSSCSTPTSSGIFRPPNSMVSTPGTRLEYV